MFTRRFSHVLPGLAVIAVFSIANTACSSAKTAEKYYQHHKDQLHYIARMCDTVRPQLPYRHASIRRRKDLGKIQIAVRATPNSIEPLYLDASLAFSPSVRFCKTCEQLLTGKDCFWRLLLAYKELNCKAVCIDEDGVFFALGNPYKTRNPEFEGGILITNGSGKMLGQMVKTIEVKGDIYVYAFDKRIP
jgi:hypothetical protein